MSAAPGNGSRDSGSQRALRTQNENRVLAALSHGGPTTQAALARSTGLSPATVSNIVRDLELRGRVARSPITSSGRRASEIRAISDRRVALGADIGRRHLRVMLMGADHRSIAVTEEPLLPDHQPEETVARAAALATRLLDEHQLHASDIIGTGVAIPAPIDPRRSQVGEPRLLPQWAAIDLPTLLQQHLPDPIFVDNDANLGALAHLQRGHRGQRISLAYLKLATGIGAGLIEDGHIIRGNRGGAGEIGHVSFEPGGAYCSCGSRGCLETVASIPVVQAAVQTTLHLTQLPSLPDIAAMVDTPAVRRILDDAGRAIGRAVAMLSATLDPQVIVIGGPLARVGEPLLTPLIDEARRFSLAGTTEETAIVACDLGDDAGVSGACGLVLSSLSHQPLG